MNSERQRLKEDLEYRQLLKKEGKYLKDRWKNWGPYLTERQWGTVREDYSPNGDAWNHTTHDMARSKAYRWGEEGIGGISDSEQRVCIALSLWNTKDSILKERMFGLTGKEGNHGEDCKEYYYYLDSSPTHSYMKMLYKYPQAEYPYERLIYENKNRSKLEGEFELIDTGIFNEDRYFDVFIEYGKDSPDDIFMKVTVYNRGPESAPIHILPTLWYRNVWEWGKGNKGTIIKKSDFLHLTGSSLGDYYFYYEGLPEVLFCENETNEKRLYGEEGWDGFAKDGINNYIILKEKYAVNPDQKGSKSSLNYNFIIPSGSSVTVRARITDKWIEKQEERFLNFDSTIEARKKETDEFYDEVQKEIEDPDQRLVQRQAFAGMLWSKQFFYFDVDEWLKGDPGHPRPAPERLKGRNSGWEHLNNYEIISMPDKWEYPWYAAWDLAFHSITFALIDPDFAKDQLVLLTREWYMHPNGQLPAYEWNFSDVNPPVHAWAAYKVFLIDKKINGGQGDIEFLEGILHKLMLNFTWWVNRKDAEGNNIFEGGFLGLDNIGVFDRSSPLPTGGRIEQSDGTSWMAMYSLNLMRIAIEVSTYRPIYQDIATKFFEHFMYIAGAMTSFGPNKSDLWNEEDEFYYDVLQKPDGERIPLKIQSMVGFIPMFAVDILDGDSLEKVPDFKRRLEWFLKHEPEMSSLVASWVEPGHGYTRLFSLLKGHRLKKLLARMLDETQFLSEYGVRALSKKHEANPYIFIVDSQEFRVDYAPGESTSGLFGGNSNWRGPIWIPVNYLIVESLRKFHQYYGKDYHIEYPVGSGKMINLQEASNVISQRLIGIFTRGKDGRRAVLGENEKFQTDPHFRDYLLFYEYFHGDNGRGVGATHQTGWTGLIAKLIQTQSEQENQGRPKDEQ